MTDLLQQLERPIVVAEERRGLLHGAILRRLEDLITEASSGLPLDGFGRVLETLGQIAEHSSNETIRQCAPTLTAALDILFPPLGPFAMVDVHDTRSSAELTSAVEKDVL